MNEKIALITGATSGIGKAAATALAKQGFTVIIHGRDQQRTKIVCEEIIGLTGNQKVNFLTADMFSLTEVQRLATEFKAKYPLLDVLVNNAGGIMNKDREITVDGHEKTIALNLLAPFLLTELLLSSLKKSRDGRIINVSSNSHQLNAKPDIKDLELEKNYDPLRAYGNSKLFLIWVTQRLAAALKQDKQPVTVNTVHPGAVATNFGVNSNLGSIFNIIGKLLRPFFKTAEKGADTIVYLATSPDIKNVSGEYFVDRKPAKVAGKYHTRGNEEVIWNYCEKQTGSFVPANLKS